MMNSSVKPPPLSHSLPKLWPFGKMFLIGNTVANPQGCVSFTIKGEGPPRIDDFSKLGRRKVFFL